MAEPVLHIKDSYYFEVPKVLCPSSFKKRADFPEVWVKLDPDFQEWEFERQILELKALGVTWQDNYEVRREWQHWVHADHANFAKPFDEFLESKYQAHLATFKTLKQAQLDEATAAKDEAKIREAKELTLDSYLKSEHVVEQPYAQFSELRQTPEFQARWSAAKTRAGDVAAYKADTQVADWSQAKIDAYNNHLSGKILIPQPFNPDLRNLYENESGFAISKFLVIEIFVGLILILVFAALARRISHGHPPKGRLWNLLEVFLVFIRDQIAKPVLGSHEHGHEGEHAAESHHNKAHGHDAHATHGHAPPAHAHAAHALTPDQKFLPLLWTIFFFVLGCNLMGMIPWAGSPTAAFAVTAALAFITLATGVVAGMMQFGFVGYFLNQIPGMDLPWYMAIVIKPMIFVIEIGGLLIKHGVLAVRLLANMVAGHLVILGIMGLAFGAEAAVKFSGAPGWQWGLTAVIAVVASAAFNILELFVAFLQAYIITFLSALFIGAAIHKH